MGNLRRPPATRNLSCLTCVCAFGMHAEAIVVIYDQFLATEYSASRENGQRNQSDICRSD